jgi:hypothetical protein
VNAVIATAVVEDDPPPLARPEGGRVIETRQAEHLATACGGYSVVAVRGQAAHVHHLFWSPSPRAQEREHRKNAPMVVGRFFQAQLHEDLADVRLNGLGA